MWHDFSSRQSSQIFSLVKRSQSMIMGSCKPPLRTVCWREAYRYFKYFSWIVILYCSFSYWEDYGIIHMKCHSTVSLFSIKDLSGDMESKKLHWMHQPLLKETHKECLTALKLSMVSFKSVFMKRKGWNFKK